MFTYVYSITALISHAVLFAQLHFTWQVRFEDIGGLEDAKRAINEAVILPLLMPEFFVGLRSLGKFVFGRFPGKDSMSAMISDPALHDHSCRLGKKHGLI